jgi:hypothetical protein
VGHSKPAKNLKRSPCLTKVDHSIYLCHNSVIVNSYVWKLDAINGVPPCFAVAYLVRKISVASRITGAWKMAMKIKPANNIVRWAVGFWWVIANTVGVYVGMLAGAILNDNVWPSPARPPGIIIDMLIDHPFERLFIIGAAIGCVVGAVELLILGRYLPRRGLWALLGSTAGWAVGLVASGYTDSFDRGLSGAFAGTIIGLALWAALNQRLSRPHWWMLAHAIGGLAVLDRIPPNLSMSVYSDTALVFISVTVGAVFGAITGFALIWLWQPHTDIEVAPQPI